jgi:hypothetical protein
VTTQVLRTVLVTASDFCLLSPLTLALGLSEKSSLRALHSSLYSGSGSVGGHQMEGDSDISMYFKTAAMWLWQHNILNSDKRAGSNVVVQSKDWMRKGVTNATGSRVYHQFMRKRSGSANSSDGDGTRDRILSSCQLRAPIMRQGTYSRRQNQNTPRLASQCGTHVATFGQLACAVFTRKPSCASREPAACERHGERNSRRPRYTRRRGTRTRTTPHLGRCVCPPRRCCPASSGSPFRACWTCLRRRARRVPC